MSTPKAIPVDPNLLRDVVSFVDVSSQTVKRALDEVAVHRTAREKAASLQQPLLTHMLAAGVIAPGEKEACAIMLGSHDTTLQLLKAAVDKLAAERKERGTVQKAAGDLGRSEADPANPQAATGSSRYNSLTSPFVGSKTAEDMKESDKVLYRVIGK